MEGGLATQRVSKGSGEDTHPAAPLTPQLSCNKVSKWRVRWPPRGGAGRGGVSSCEQGSGGRGSGGPPRFDNGRISSSGRWAPCENFIKWEI